MSNSDSPTWMFVIRLVVGMLFLMPGMMKLIMPDSFKEMMFDQLLGNTLLWDSLLNSFNDNFSMFALSLGMVEMILGLVIILGILPRLFGLVALLMGVLLTSIWIPSDFGNVFFLGMIMMHVVMYIIFPLLLFLKDSNAVFSPFKDRIPESLQRWQ